MTDPALYLIPVPLSDVPVENVLPASNLRVVGQIKHFVVENLRSARRFLKACDKSIDIDELHFDELNRYTDPSALDAMLDPIERGFPVGVISEAGCPAVADPGADLVAIAQRRGMKVVPMVGPSSILMGLMASGFNGQSFAFHGYLPIDTAAKSRAIKEMQRRIDVESQTQIFIETPYRNDALLSELTRVLPPRLRLCVATDISGAHERILTRTIAQWKRQSVIIGKVPTIFLLYK